MNARLLILIHWVKYPFSVKLSNISSYFKTWTFILNSINISIFYFQKYLLVHFNSLLSHLPQNSLHYLLEILFKWRLYNYAILNNLECCVSYHLLICIVYSVYMAIGNQHTAWSFHTEPLDMWGSEMMSVLMIYINLTHQQRKVDHV